MKHLILSILGLCLFISSCNDHLKIEKNDLPQGVADSQMVGSWKIIAVSSDVAYDWNNDGSTERDIYSTWSSCQRDNLYTFSGDTATGADKRGTFKLNCSTTKNGVWQIVDDNRKWYLLYTPETLLLETERYISMTAVEFKTAIDLTLPSGQPATITKTWARQ